MAGLEVQLGADIKDFQKKIQEVENDIQQLANEKAVNIKLGLDTKELDSHIKDAKKTLNDLKTTAKDAGLAFQKDFAPKVANGANALTQFNRIVQDAPFGATGVQNNITAFGEAFGYLIKETGSAKEAFKVMTASLIGTGGVMLAISAVTSGLTYMQQKGLSVSDVFNKLTGDFNESRKAMQDLSVETAKNAQAQISTVGAYVAAAKNINLSMEDRLIAVKKLQDEYPAYFGNLTKEQILNGNVATTVREVTQALIAKAKAAALTDRIVKLAEEEEKNQNNVNNSIAGMARLYKLTKKEAFDFAVVLNKQIRGQIDLVGELERGNANNLSKVEKQALAAFQYSKTLQGLSEDVKSNLAQQDRLTNSLEKQTAAQIKLDFQKEKSAKKTFDTPQVNGVESFLSLSGLKDLNTIEAFNGKIDEFKNKLRELPGTITTSFKGVRQNVSSESLKTLEVMSEFNKKVSEILNKGTSDAISGLGEAIGGALQKGGNVFSTVGDSLLSTLGGILIELGKMAISTGIGILAIQTALKSLNPYVAIGAGVALVALGSAVKGSVKGLGNTASSNASTGNYNTGASYGSPASSSSYASGGGSSASYGSGTVVFEIAGTKLLGVLNNTMNENKRLGGALG